MGQKTNIAWTDATFNPWWGCTKVSPGCDNCYAEAFDKRTGGSHWGKGQPRRVFGDRHWTEPIRWDLACAKSGTRMKVFCSSMADVMDDEAPEGERQRLWNLIDATPHLDWLLLTKRPHRYMRYLPSAGFRHANAWLGATAENQHYYNVRWPELSRAAGAFGTTAWISYEPAIGPLSMRWLEAEHGIPDWLIFGGESGHNRRPMQQDWAESIKAECEQLRVAFFMKQLSARTPGEGARLIPADLLIRQFPEAHHG